MRPADAGRACPSGTTAAAVRTTAKKERSDARVHIREFPMSISLPAWCDERQHEKRRRARNHTRDHALRHALRKADARLGGVERHTTAARRFTKASTSASPSAALAATRSSLPGGSLAAPD